MSDKGVSSSDKTSSSFLTLKNDPSAPALLAYEVRNAEGAESEQVIEQRSKFIKDRLDSLTEEQLTRFEFFMRSHFPKNRIKEIMNEALGPKQLVTDEMVIVVSGLAKLFVGEICDTAMQVKNERGASGGILYEHVMEAHRRMQNDGRIGNKPDHHYFLSSDNLFAFKEFPFINDDAYAQAMKESLQAKDSNHSTTDNEEENETTTLQHTRDDNDNNNDEEEYARKKARLS